MNQLFTTRTFFCFFLLIHIIFSIFFFSYFSSVIAKSMLSLLTAICFDDFTVWYSVLLSVRQMIGIAVVGKISLIIDLIQNAFHDASISDIASATNVLSTIFFILCDCQAMGFMLSEQKIINILGNHLLPCLQTKHHRTQVVLILLDCLSSLMSRLFLYFCSTRTVYLCFIM